MKIYRGGSVGLPEVFEHPYVDDDPAFDSWGNEFTLETSEGEVAVRFDNEDWIVGTPQEVHPWLLKTKGSDFVEFELSWDLDS